MRVRFILRFLVTLLVSILLTVTSHFFVTSDCWSLQWGKNRLNAVCACDGIEQDGLPISLEVGRICF